MQDMLTADSLDACEAWYRNAAIARSKRSCTLISVRACVGVRGCVWVCVWVCVCACIQGD